MARIILWFSITFVFINVFCISQIAQAREYPDQQTDALWLFDDVDYLNATLTECSANQYDLRLCNGNLVDGRFGQALTLGKGLGASAWLASPDALFDGGRYSVPFREIKQPKKILQALQADAWTIEFWFNRLADRTAPMLILEMGEKQTPDLSISYLPAENKFRLGNWIKKTKVDFLVDSKELALSQWHHVAFTADHGKYLLYLDGRLLKTAQTGEVEAVTAAYEQYQQGLVGAIYNDKACKEFMATLDASQIQQTAADKRDVMQAQQFMGFLIPQQSGEVELSLENKGSLPIDAFLELDGKKIFQGNGPTQWQGGLTLKAHQVYPLLLQWNNQRDEKSSSGTVSLDLYWQYAGNTRELVPASVLAYNQDNIRKLKQMKPRFKNEFRYNLVLGWQAESAPEPYAAIDELRISSGIRYTTTFTPPQSFTTKSTYRKDLASTQSETPLLFSADQINAILPFGARKHLFLDDAIIEEGEGVKIGLNQPAYGATVEVEKVGKERVFPDRKEKVHQFPSFIERDGKIYMIYTNLEMWGKYPQPETRHYAVVSDDGLHFSPDAPELSKFEQTPDGPVIIRGAYHGTFFKDLNPACPLDELYKFTALQAGRGIYLLTSPDGLNWKRNESVMLPFDSGGNSETFWDNQRQRYVSYNRTECHWSILTGTEVDPGGRAMNFTLTDDPTSPWPFQKSLNPIRRDIMTQPTVSSELPVVFVPNKTGDVYMTRAIKYPWAADTYIAFVWRLHGKLHLPHEEYQANEIRQVGFAVSRDGIHWKYFDDMYMPAGWQYQGKTVTETLCSEALIRHGDILWQYGEIMDGRHLGGDKTFEKVVRYTQRLDGFTSVNADKNKVWFVTKPLHIDAETLKINAKVSGSLKIGIMDIQYNKYPEFAIEQCDDLSGDNIAKQVTWAGHGDVSRLKGKPIRLRFELENAKLYGFEFAK